MYYIRFRQPVALLLRIDDDVGPAALCSVKTPRNSWYGDIHKCGVCYMLFMSLFVTLVTEVSLSQRKPNLRF